MKPRYVYTIETNDEGCISIYKDAGKAIARARDDYEATFPRGSVAALREGSVALGSVPWDSDGDIGLTVARREVL